jgi:hypothetical protein
MLTYAVTYADVFTRVKSLARFIQPDARTQVRAYLRQYLYCCTSFTKKLVQQYKY